LGLDFDGTLAPIVVDPAEARPDSDTLALLTELAAGALQLAVISGRDTDDLVERLPIPNALLIGNHGLEERRAGRSRLSAVAEPFAANLRRAAAAVAALNEAQQPGVRIERKRAAISVHFRDAGDPKTAGPALAIALRPVAERERLRLHGGRMIWELRPAVEVNKGTIVTGLATSLRPEALVYIGDDITDADAFAAMRRLPSVRTFAVGVRSSEVPVDTFADCDLVLEGIDQVNLVLRELLGVG
jgi:trehalose-phosphatase